LIPQPYGQEPSKVHLPPLTFSSDYQSRNALKGDEKHRYGHDGEDDIVHAKGYNPGVLPGGVLY
jgi:hypothetical protein